MHFENYEYFEVLRYLDLLQVHINVLIVRKSPLFIELQLKESFKDIKKKFNNLKFNYTKKNEKARNLKALKYQIQQVETYAEKLQVMIKCGCCVCVCLCMHVCMYYYNY